MYVCVCLCCDVGWDSDELWSERVWKSEDKQQTKQPAEQMNMWFFLKNKQTSKLPWDEEFDFKVKLEEKAFIESSKTFLLASQEIYLYSWYSGLRVPNT